MIRLYPWRDIARQDVLQSTRFNTKKTIEININATHHSITRASAYYDWRNECVNTRESRMTPAKYSGKYHGHMTAECADHQR